MTIKNALLNDAGLKGPTTLVIKFNRNKYNFQVYIDENNIYTGHCDKLRIAVEGKTLNEIKDNALQSVKDELEGY
jgi:hypothetical protein